MLLKFTALRLVKVQAPLNELPPAGTAVRVMVEPSVPVKSTERESPAPVGTFPPGRPVEVGPQPLIVSVVVALGATVRRFCWSVASSWSAPTFE